MQPSNKGEFLGPPGSDGAPPGRTHIHRLLLGWYVGIVYNRCGYSIRHSGEFEWCHPRGFYEVDRDVLAVWFLGHVELRVSYGIEPPDGLFYDNECRYEDHQCSVLASYIGYMTT